METGNAQTASDKCPVCGNTQSAEYRAGMQPLMLRCAVCTLVWQPVDRSNPRINERYGEDYYDAWGDIPQAREAKLRTFSSHLHRLERWARKGRLLDVGCAMGFLLEAAETRGWEPWGLEVSSHAAGKARTKYGNERVHIGTLEDAPFSPGCFQAVTMTDVVEHLPDPLGSLKLAATLLADEGCLLVATPQIGCLSERVMGRTWFQIKDEHLQLFSPKALATALEMAGFEIVLMRPARKMMTIAYLTHHFSVYRRRIITPLLALLAKALGPLSGTAVPMPTGEQLVIARKLREAESGGR